MSKPKLFVQTELTGGTDTLITAASGYTYSIGYISIANKSTASATVQVKCGTSGATRLWLPITTIKPGGYIEWTGPPQNLEASQILQMTASAASTFEVLVSGFETEV